VGARAGDAHRVADRRRRAQVAAAWRSTLVEGRAIRGPPADAKPLNIPGYPDLYGVAADGREKFYLRIAPGVDSYHPKGGWVVTTIAADAPTADIVKLIFVPNS
jgi:hypothetical protein